MEREQKRTALRIAISALAFVILCVAFGRPFFDGEFWIYLKPALYAAVYLLAGYDVIAKAVRNIFHGQLFDENFLMLTASVAAFCIGEFSEGVAVMLFYQTGELFQDYAVGKSRRNIADMMDISPEYANIERDGCLTEVDPEEVAVGDIILIKPGERVPLDGVVTDGASTLDTSALTGESVPRSVSVGDEILSGCVNGGGTLRVRVTKSLENSTVTRILELVENASSKKARVENFITRFARVYTPLVTLCAVLVSVIPPLFFSGTWSEWIRRGCTFLVISCPCALVISVPLGFFGGIGAASKIGVLVKGSNYFEALSRLKTVVFDKTGTLTKGEFSVCGIYPLGVSGDELLRIAAICEGYSNHPIALSVTQAYCGDTMDADVNDCREIAGKGVCAVIDGKPAAVGNAELMGELGIEFKENADGGTAVYVAYGERFIGSITIADAVKDKAPAAIADIKRQGVKQCVMLTGDRESAAKFAAETIGIDEWHAGLLPEDKVQIVQNLISREAGGEKLAFVGDGINDAPVLAGADVGIAMGNMGSDAAIEAADVVIMDDDISKIPSIIRIARRTLRIVRQNIVFALSVKTAVMLLGAVGAANMWMAVFADVGVSVLAILNSMRAMKR